MLALRRVRRIAPIAIVLAAMALLVAVLSAPGDAGAADHLDAPGLTPPSGIGEADIADVYVFDGTNANKTVLAMTTNPAAGVLTPEAFGTEIVYQFKIDTNGDALTDIAYKFRFSPPGVGGAQDVTVKRAVGSSARSNEFTGQTIGTGSTDSVISLGGPDKAWAGLRSDPFFFDLEGFLGSVEGIGDRAFLDGDQTDFFDGLNVMAIVLEVADTRLGGNIGVWAATAVAGNGPSNQVDRMGRPAINTVFNASVFGGPSGEKNRYNARRPNTDIARYHDLFSDRLVALTTLLGAPYSAGTADAIMDLLLPDVVTYDTSTAADGTALNGRHLADDVIDFELGVVTNGVVPGDGIGPHDDYLRVFPYLGTPN